VLAEQRQLSAAAHSGKSIKISGWDVIAFLDRDLDSPALGFNPGKFLGCGHLRIDDRCDETIPFRFAFH